MTFLMCIWLAELIREYEHWEYLKEFGGSDPNYDDGVNMNLTRNHIIHWKQSVSALKMCLAMYPVWQMP